MKRYLIESEDRKACSQFPAADKQQAVQQAKRHAATLGIEAYRVAYIGKWRGEENPETFTVVPA